MVYIYKYICRSSLFLFIVFYYPLPITYISNSSIILKQRFSRRSFISLSLSRLGHILSFHSNFPPPLFFFFFSHVSFTYI